MNTIVVDYYDIDFGCRTEYPFLHEFLFDKFRLIMKNTPRGEIDTEVYLFGDGDLEIFNYKTNGVLDEGDGQGVSVDDNRGHYWGGLEWDEEKCYYYPAGFFWCTESESTKDYNRLELIVGVMRYIVCMLEEREKNVFLKDKPTKSVGQIKQTNTDEPQRCYLLKDIKKYFYIEKNIGSGSQKNCPCWSVRGHYRHYKSGKVVFVENYLKGKDRANIKPKEKRYVV